MTKIAAVVAAFLAILVGLNVIWTRWKTPKIAVSVRYQTLPPISPETRLIRVLTNDGGYNIIT